MQIRNFFLKSIFNDTNLKKIAAHSSMLIGAEILALLISLFQGVVVARYLNVSGYGIVALVVGYATIVNQLIDFRIREAVVKFGAEFSAQNDRPGQAIFFGLCYLLDFSTGFIAFLIVISSAHLAAGYLFHNLELTPLIKIYSLVLLFSTVDGASLGILMLFEKFSFLASYTIFSSLTKFLCVFFFVSANRGIQGVLYAYLCSTILCSGILFWFSLKTIKINVWTRGLKFKPSLLSPKLRQIILFLLNSNLNETLAIFLRNADIIILGYFRPVPEVGIFKMAKNIGECLHLLTIPIGNALYPRISYLWYSGKKNQGLLLLRNLSLVTSAIFLSVSVLLYITSPWFIRYLLKEGFLPSVWALRIMLPGIAIAGIFLWIRPMFLVIGKPHILTFINASNVLIMLMASAIFVPGWGFKASAVIYIYPYFAGHLFGLFYLLRKRYLVYL